MTRNRFILIWPIECRSADGHGALLCFASELRGLLPSQVIFLVTMLELESMRSACVLPASLPTYFVNESVNGSTALSLCMESVADKVAMTHFPTLCFL